MRMRPIIRPAYAGVPASMLLAALARTAHAATITFISAPVSPDFPQPVGMSADGRVVFGGRPSGGTVYNPTSQPWRWSAQAGYVEPPLPAGTSTGRWQSATATGDVAFMTGRTPTASGGWTNTTVLVDAAGTTHPLVSPIAGYTPYILSGDGRSMLLIRNDEVGTGVDNDIAVAGPAGVRYVTSSAGWNTQASDLSYDGSVVSGFTWPQGASPNDSRLVRWTSGATYGGAASGYGPPAGWHVMSGAGLSPDGALLSGMMQDSSLAYHPFLFSEAGGFEIAAGIPTNLPYTAGSITLDNSLAFISGPPGLETYVWRRGVGTVTTVQYLAQNGVDVSSISGSFFYGMSSDGNTFIGEGGSAGGLVPILVTIPAPGGIAIVLLGALVLARSRRESLPVVRRRLARP
jgi:hypothetical protein